MTRSTACSMHCVIGVVQARDDVRHAEQTAAHFGAHEVRVVELGDGGHDVAIFDTFGEFEVLRFSLDLSSTDKRTIRVGELERDHDVRIIAFERSDGSASSIPTRDSILYNGDSVLACVRHELIESFSRYIQD